MVNLVSLLMEEGFEFCFTQSPNIKGISKDSILKRFKIYKSTVGFNYFKATYDLDLTYNSEDENYVYIEEVK